MTNVIPLRATTAPRKLPSRRRPARRQLLDMLHRQADRAALNDWSHCSELRDLARLVRVRRPGTRTIIWRGIRFPLRFSLVMTSVRCPETGRGLIGVIQ